MYRCVIRANERARVRARGGAGGHGRARARRRVLAAAGHAARADRTPRLPARPPQGVHRPFLRTYAARFATTLLIIYWMSIAFKRLCDYPYLSSLISGLLQG